MKKEQEMVREFHEKSGAEVAFKPRRPAFSTLCLRAELIHEEWKELLEAIGVGEIDGQVKDWDSIDYDKYDPVAVADALGDLLYVVLGTAVSCGIDITPIFHEIHRSNMTKFIDGHRRSDGKWIKGPSYSLANLKPILDAQT